MLDAFFTSIDESVWAPHRDRKETVGGKLLVHGKSFPKLKKTKLALIGNGPEADAFRKSFYRLNIFDSPSIFDRLYLQRSIVHWIRIQFTTLEVFQRKLD